jgi:hypothetical protein
MAIEEPRTNLAQTIASNLEAVIDPAVVLALGIEQVPVPVQVIVQAAVRALAIAQAAELVRAIVPAVAQERGTDLAAVPVLVIVQAVEAQAQVIVQAVEAGLELVPAAEPAINPVEAQVLVQVAAPARIKSATAAHHRGQVRVPIRAEDLAAVVVATMHAPAATEAAIAWAAAE